MTDEDNALTIRTKRETVSGTSQTSSDVASERIDSFDDRDKRQIRYGRVQQGALLPPTIQAQSWSDAKTYTGNDHISSSYRPPSYQANSKVPFKPSAQIDETYSPYTATSISSYNKQYNNQGSFKPYIPDNNKVFSTSTPSRTSVSSTPNYSFYSSKNQNSNSPTYILSSTPAVPIYKENFQYFSMKPSSSPSAAITKAPPISSLSSITEGPFAALSGGFYNNKPRTNPQYTKPVQSSKPKFETHEPVIQSSLQYHFEIGGKNPQEGGVLKSSPKYQSSNINYASTVKANPGTSSTSTRNRDSRNKANVKPQESRYSENYDVRNNSNNNRVRGGQNNQQRPKPDQHHDSSNDKPKNQKEEEEDYEEDEESEDEEEEEEDANKNEENDKEAEQSPEIKPPFPDPPEYFKNIGNKYENVVNPFADPEFDFDTFISKIRNNHLSQVSPKPDNVTYRTNDHRGNIHSGNVKNPGNQKFISQHHNYPGMSTPRPFSSSQNGVSWPAKVNNVELKQNILYNHSYTPESTKPIYEDEEYYDDDYELPSPLNNQVQVPKPIHNQVKSPKQTYLTPVKPSLSTYYSSSQAPVFKGDHRNSLVNVAQYHQPSYNRKPSQQNEPIKPIAVSVQSHIRNDHQKPQQIKVQNTNYISNPTKKPPTPPRYSPPTNQNDKHRIPIKTEKPPTKRRPIPKPSPEMNDYYYDDEDEDYDYEPPVKSKFMPSTEVKPQRPPIAQNYEEYEDYETDIRKPAKSGNSNRHKQTHENETTNDDDEDDDDEGEDEEVDNVDEAPQLKRPINHKAVSNNGYSSQYVNHHSITPSKDAKIITPATYETYVKTTQHTKPSNPISAQVQLSRPEVLSYDIVHKPSNRLPISQNHPKYLNQTTLRPYTVRHRLAKPSSTQQTSVSTRKEPTVEPFTRHPTRGGHKVQIVSSTPSGNDGRTFRQPTRPTKTTSTTTKVKTDNDNQESRDSQTEHDDNAPNRYCI